METIVQQATQFFFGLSVTKHKNCLFDTVTGNLFTIYGFYTFILPRNVVPQHMSNGYWAR